MEFSEKLTDLRRREGWSQEQLADRLGVTRQSVSKWEGGAAMPELEKLIALSELFSVSVDYLVKADYEEPERPAEMPASTARLEAQMDEISRYFRGWAWDSKTKVFGLPLVSVRFRLSGRVMRGEDVAKGIIAVGNVAVGLVSLGVFSVGLLSLGICCVGALALGVMAFGLAALGVTAIGLLAFGVVAAGLWYAAGLSALSRGIAVGMAALGETAVGLDAAGAHALLWGDGLTFEEVEAFLLAHHPDLWKPLLHLLSAAGASLK